MVVGIPTSMVGGHWKLFNSLESHTLQMVQVQTRPSRYRYRHSYGYKYRHKHRHRHIR